MEKEEGVWVLSLPKVDHNTPVALIQNPFQHRQPRFDILEPLTKLHIKIKERYLINLIMMI